MVKINLGLFEGGYTMDSIVNESPELTPKDVSPTLKYVSELIDGEKVNSDF